MILNMMIEINNADYIFWYLFSIGKNPFKNILMTEGSKNGDGVCR